MSELFNALQKLEEKNTPDAAPQPPPVSAGSDKKGKRGIPYLKAIVLLVLILFVTAMSAAFLWYQEGSSFLTSLMQQIDAPEKIILPDPDEPLPLSPEVEETVVTVKAVAVIEAVHPVEAGGTEVEVLTVEKENAENAENAPPMTVDERMVPVVEENNLPQTTMQQDIATINREFIRSENLSEMDESTAFEHQQKDRRHVQRKRLIYRAEKLRLQGDNRLALDLYVKAWGIKSGPALANNIAAILISFAEYGEAERYLLTGLQLAANDKDLAYNLEIVKQNRDKK